MQTEMEEMLPPKLTKNQFNDLFIRSIRQDFFQMFENPLIRFLGSSVALASLPSIEIFGSIIHDSIHVLLVLHEDVNRLVKQLVGGILKC